VTEGQPPRLTLNVTEVRRHLGSTAAVSATLEASGLSLSDVAVPDRAEISLEGQIESMFEGVVLTGIVTTPWTGTCRRCLGPVEGVVEVEVREIYSTDPVDGETWPLVADQIDVGPLLHDTALLSLPLAPLCSQGCLGPAPEAFPATVEGEGSRSDDDGEPARDPRWAALDDLDL